ncbi:hypothetical protein KC332_g8768 [Hortaea werneckii]|nr:hypothetical protein KC350_g9378 [Hortaea werneckii]KAI6849631.1 hypothetical protein KC358_g1124 [Hortaea werneckii]KAI6935849.1 hypothetical protein KC341_g6641 [Hortaea werneckii]KAI6949477.1 hypothetical protein KC348_g1306 [Hortaea werneckii]KAI6981532.1 hypothetical protein KC321_g1174 [Hortaea werneckii]
MPCTLSHGLPKAAFIHQGQRAFPGPAVLGTGFLLHRQAICHRFTVFTSFDSTNDMTMAALPWDQARWRDVHSHHFASERVHAAPAPPLAAPTAINPSSQSVILGGYQHESHAWQRDGLAAPERDMTAQSSSAGDSIHTAAYNNRTEERQTPPDSKTNRSQPLAGITPPFELPSDGWRPLHQPYHRASVPHIANTPLTLHIPRQDLHRTSSAHDDSLHGRRAQTATHQSLPSFATFSEHTANRKDDPDVDGPEIAPMASRLSCHSCNKLKPQLRELALAAAEVDENVQNVFNRPLIRTLDLHDSNPERTIQWILDRLQRSKKDLQEAFQRGLPSLGQRVQAHISTDASRPVSPTNPLKRNSAWDRDQLPVPKRPRSGASPNQTMAPPHSGGSYGERSLDFSARGTFSPAPTDTAPPSAYPRQGSPFSSGRGPRGLPSPSSLAYAPSVAPSLAPPTAQSATSPIPSYEQPLSIHTASANSATSAHIADLQHQVTLKSLSLQTLQSEYASLLQKLQRERVKSQAIEKKTSVADNEVNELTGRNEELLEQVKTLEGRVEELERKREQERSDAAREKEQWGRMLEMGTRLQARHADDRQKLMDEREELRSRIAALEGSQTDRARVGGSEWSSNVPSTEPPQAHGASKELSMPKETTSQKGASAGFAEDFELLKREVRSLKDQRDLLRSALAAVRTHNNTLQATLAEVSLQNRTIAEDIDKCLGKEDAMSAQMEPSHTRPSSASGRATPKVPTSNAPPTSDIAVKSVAPPEKVNQTGEVSTVLRDAATIGRAVSPGPAELGFSVEPSSSSPEDLIRALGPLPTAGPQTSTKPDQSTLRTSPSRSSGTAFNRSNGTPSHLHQPNNNTFTYPPAQPPRPHCENAPSQEQTRAAKPRDSIEGYNPPNLWNQSSTSPPRDTSSTPHYSQDATTRRPSGASFHFQSSSSSTGGRGCYSAATQPSSSLSTYARDMTPNPKSNPRSETYAPPAAFRHWPPPSPQQQQNQNQDQRVHMPPPPRPM